MAGQNKDSAYGWVLVGSQFLLIAVLIVQIFQTGFRNSDWFVATGACLLLGGLVLFVVTQLFNRPGNWSVHPLPMGDAQFITSGPYHWIRHPMYTAALLCAAGAMIWAHNWLSLLCLFALLVVFVQKIKIEEREMAAKFSSWDEYAARTHRLVPGLW